MKYIELEAGIPAIETLYTKTKGALALRARNLKPLFEAYKAYKEEQGKLFKEAGATEEGNGMLRVPRPEESDKEALEKYNKFLEDWRAMQEEEVSFELKTKIPLEDLAEVEITNPEIDVLVSLGIVEE